jgi:hypothetical protein
MDLIGLTFFTMSSGGLANEKDLITKKYFILFFCQKNINITIKEVIGKYSILLNNIMTL